MVALVLPNAARVVTWVTSTTGSSSRCQLMMTELPPLGLSRNVLLAARGAEGDQRRAYWKFCEDLVEPGLQSRELSDEQGQKQAHLRWGPASLPR